MFAAAAAAKLLQSCLTLCDPIDSSPPGSPVPGILQARTLEWVAISFSNAWKWKVKVKCLSRVGLLETPWTAAYQAPPSMGFSRQEYWSGLPLPSPMRWIAVYESHILTAQGRKDTACHAGPWGGCTWNRVNKHDLKESEFISIKGMRWLLVSTEGRDWLVWIIPRAGRQLRHATLGWVRTVPNPYGKGEFFG